MQLFEEVSNLATEQRNSESMNMDELSTREILLLVNKEDAKVAEAVRAEIPEIEKVVDVLVSKFELGGRLFYVGAGTSGRLGVIDAAECPPTFGTKPQMIQAIIAGGDKAVFRSQEGAEDSIVEGAKAIELQRVTSRDVVIGIAASRRTPFVLAALERAHSHSAFTVLLTTNPRNTIDFAYLSAAICPVVGPEVLMGSTRMKSAVAQKMVLTMITTTTMVKLGKVYQNMMVDLQLTNKKLEERSKRIVMLATGCDYTQAGELLEASGKHVKTAIVMQMKHLDRDEARLLLSEHNGFVKAALAET